MRWLPAGCRQRMLPAETKDDRLRETGKPPGQNSPTRGSCPNTGSQSAPREGESKGRPRRERLFLHSQIGLKQSREALPRRRRWGRRPRHGDTETPRRGEAGSLSPSGGEQKQGARSGSFIKTLPRLAGVQARSGVPGPGWLSPASLVVPPLGLRGRHLRSSQRQVKGSRLSRVRVFSPGLLLRAGPGGLPRCFCKSRLCRCDSCWCSGRRVGSPSRNTFGA